MKFVILGTASGAPTTKRNTSALAFNKDQNSNWFLFDCGEGTQKQLMKSGISIAKISDIFISHLHGDHIFGIFGLIATRNLQQSNKPLNIYGPKGLKELIQNILKVTKTGIRYELNFFEINSQQTFSKNNMKIVPVEMKHGIETYGFYLQENDFPGKFDVKKALNDGIKPGPIYKKLKNKEKINLENGKTIDGNDYVGKSSPGRKIFIGSDNADPFILKKLLTECDLLIHEATYTKNIEDKINEKYFHSTAYNVGKFAESINLENLIVTHFSARYKTFVQENEPSLNDIKDEIELNFKKILYIAKDFDRFHLDRDKKLLKI